MKIEVNEDREIILKEIFSGIGLESESGEEFGICMRDSGFEFNYGGGWYEAKEGKVRKMGLSGEARNESPGKGMTLREYQESLNGKEKENPWNVAEVLTGSNEFEGKIRPFMSTATTGKKIEPPVISEELRSAAEGFPGVLPEREINPSADDLKSKTQRAAEEKPPLGIKPKWVHDQERSNDLVETIERYLSAGIKIPLEWIEEFNEWFGGGGDEN